MRKSQERYVEQILAPMLDKERTQERTNEWRQHKCQRRHSNSLKYLLCEHTSQISF